jgi:hypothetical protein
MLPSNPPAGPDQPDGAPPPRAPAPLLEAGRRLRRENPRLNEAEFRSAMLERFRAGDEGLQSDRANMTAGEASGVFAILLLPWTLLRWLGWRGRLARHHAEMDEVVAVLRREGHFA